MNFHFNTLVQCNSLCNYVIIYFYFGFILSSRLYIIWKKHPFFRLSVCLSVNILFMNSGAERRAVY